MSLKRVCIFTSGHRVLDARVFYRQAMSLAHNGYHVQIWGDHPKDEIIENIDIHAVPKFSNGLVGKISSSFRFFFHLYNVKADIFHFHDPDLIFCGLLLRAIGKKVVMDVHEDFKLTIIKKRKKYPKHIGYCFAVFFDMVEKITAMLLSGVIVVSEEIARKFYFANVAVVRNFPIIDENSISHDRSDQSFIVIYSGVIGESRGCWSILEGFSLFCRRFPNSKLRIMGRFESKDLELEFKNRAAEIGSVEILGHLPWVEVKQQQLKADVGLVISFFQKDSNEKAYPVKLFEYLAAGLPVIISRKRYWEHLLEEGKFGVMVDGKDFQEICDALYWLATDKNARVEMGLSGKKFAEHNFSWENEFNEMKVLYDGILK